MNFSFATDRLRHAGNAATLERSESLLRRARSRDTLAFKRRSANVGVRSIPEPSQAMLATKRAIDVSGALFGLVVFAPLFIGIAIAIKVTSKGPVFFRQKRYGYHNRRFWIFKFRTMYADRGDARGVQQTVGNDPRVTPIGRILRKSSLDELPQLINVLKGDMSLVGPRPHVPGMLAGGMLYEQLTPYYFQRHMMRPGITGLAQVSGFRGETTVALPAIERLDYDLRYIATWSLWLDIKIILRTVIREVTRGSGG
ncbi:sugar transferase [Pseudolabrys sp. FHR47]|uniref:sugar transferase n=1 Tax=Pseudolabrys sp. FHR47 TaxID=2562284 RepID=UPI0010BE364A|nr:sugar transferase [Pseudolabrys sp. FHR47]